MQTEQVEFGVIENGMYTRERSFEYYVEEALNALVPGSGYAFGHGGPCSGSRGERFGSG